jgi:hypothetical protein
MNIVIHTTTVDCAFDYLLFLIQRNIKDRRYVLILANVFDILSCASYFFINDTHWALLFSGAALHSLSTSLSNGTHQAIVAWWLVEIDATKYRNYFLNLRLFYEFVGTGVGIVAGFYVHVYLFDAVFSIADVFSSIKSGRKHRAIFFIASIVYLVKAVVLLFHPKQKFLLHKLDLVRSSNNESLNSENASVSPDGDLESPVDQDDNIGSDLAMEGVKSKKEYMERNRRIFREKVAKQEVKSDLYNDLGRFWFEDETRTWMMDINVLCKIARSTIGVFFCTTIPNCISCCITYCCDCCCCFAGSKSISPPIQERQGRRKNGGGGDEDSGFKEDHGHDDDGIQSKTQNPLETYLPARKLVEISVFRAVNYHMKAFLQAFIIVYPFLQSYRDGRDSTTISIWLCVVYFVYALSTYLSQLNSKYMRETCTMCETNGLYNPAPWKSRRIVQLSLRVTAMSICFAMVITLLNVGIGTSVFVVLCHFVMNASYGLSSSHCRYMVGKISTKYIGNERGSIEAGIKFLTTIFICIISPLFGHAIDQESTLVNANASNFSLVSIRFAFNMPIHLNILTI